MMWEEIWRQRREVGLGEGGGEDGGVEMVTA